MLPMTGAVGVLMLLLGLRLEIDGDVLDGAAGAAHHLQCFERFKEDIILF